MSIPETLPVAGPMSIAKVVETRRKYSLNLTKVQLMAAFQMWGISVPDNARITMQVPGGGDWSNTAIELGDDVATLDINWEETTRE